MICPAKDFGQTIQVVVGKHPQIRAAKARCIDNGGVDPFIDRDHIMRVDQGANHPDAPLNSRWRK
jgi:hypothetical protein